MSESIVDIVQRVRERRVIDLYEVPNTWHCCYVREDHKIGFRGQILRWVDEYTTGKFYIDANNIIFEKSEDAFIFELGFGNPAEMI